MIEDDQLQSPVVLDKYCKWGDVSPFLAATVVHLNDLGGGLPTPACFIFSIEASDLEQIARFSALCVLESCLNVRKLRKAVVERCDFR
jgi:hypothetical protein